MADKKISALTGATTPLAGTEVLPIVQGAATVKVAVSNLTAGRAISALGVTISGLTASTALALDASKNVVSVTNTGTGSNVLATAPTLVGDVSLSTGNLVIGTAGKGIDFTQDPNPAGMTSELLDDYEEGTWTPVPVNLTVSGDPTYAGAYVKIGKLVICTIAISATTSTLSTAGTTYASGLPFAQSGDFSSCGWVDSSSQGSLGVSLIGNSFIYFQSWSTGAGARAVGSFCYLAA